jgi:hypothetical protein
MINGMLIALIGLPKVRWEHFFLTVLKMVRTLAGNNVGQANGSLADAIT